MNKSKRYKVPTECGYYESVTIEPFGTVVAKFDTGNSINCVLHADDIKVVGNQVTFKHKDKTYKTKHFGTYTSVTGGGEDERWVIDLDMEFAGTIYPNIKFGVDNREDLTSDVLLNREIMSIMNVMIKARRKYVVTTKFSVEEK